MAASPGEKSKTTKVLIFIFICIILIAFLAPASLPKSAMEKEISMTNSIAGEKITLEISRTAQKINKALVDKDQWVKTVRDVDLPLANKTKLSKMLVERTEAITSTLEATSFRLASILAWLLPALPLLMATVLDGLLERKIRQYRFSYTSHGVHASTGTALAFIFLGLLAGMFIPAPIPYVGIVFIIPFIMVFVWVWLANLPKRL